MTTYVYKVSAPRADGMFYPSTFWHTLDWESSTPRRREGYIEDEVLFAGDFDEVSIHLLPRVRTIRVRSIDVEHWTLRGLGLQCAPGKTAYIFSPRSRQREVESFRPTIFKFKAEGFTRIRKGEYIARIPQQAISHETIAMAEAVHRWNIQACFVDNLDNLTARLARQGIYFDEQT